MADFQVVFALSGCGRDCATSSRWPGSPSRPTQAISCASLCLFLRSWHFFLLHLDKTAQHAQQGMVRPMSGVSGNCSWSSPNDDSDHEIGDIQITRALRAAFVCLGGVDLVVMFKTRAHVMKSPAKFLRGAYGSARRVALRE